MATSNANGPQGTSVVARNAAHIDQIFMALMNDLSGETERPHLRELAEMGHQLADQLCRQVASAERVIPD